jgi:hypothetical protein
VISVLTFGCPEYISAELRWLPLIDTNLSVKAETCFIYMHLDITTGNCLLKGNARSETRP